MAQSESEALLERFLAGDFAAGEFTHARHIQVAWALLRETPFLEALTSYAGAIRAMAERFGVPDKYNTTITVAFLGLVAERAAALPAASWEEFAEANPDLMDKNVLAAWYGTDRLNSDAAREIFLLPDRAA